MLEITMAVGVNEDLDEASVMLPEEADGWPSEAMENNTVRQDVSDTMKEGLEDWEKGENTFRVSPVEI